MRYLLLSIPSVVCLAITAIRWRVHLRQGAQVDAATTVVGVVVAEGSEPVVELVLELKIPRSSTGMSVEETGRALHVRPFLVKTDDGELIEVAPPRTVRLHAPLGRARKIEDHKRYTKTAQVRVGDRVYLVGSLHDAAPFEGGPFREGARPHRHIAPSLIATARLGETARQRAANDKQWLRRWGLMAVLGPLPYLMPLVALFVIAFWIRGMVVAQSWWEKRSYSEYYGSGTTREDRREYQ
ncbi:MAG: hypothetical protein ABI551_13645 [Polyangiaceae bacterium]